MSDVIPPLPIGDALRRALAAPRSGRLEAIVVRLGHERHATPAHGRLTRAGCLVGDRWAIDPRPERQLTVMDARVVRWLLAQRAAPKQAALIAHEALDLPGDNLVVDWPTGADEVPAGTRWRLGAALIETNDVPHMGCKKFEARFGRPALEWINAPEHRALRMRGIHATVIEEGAIAVGDVLVPVTSG